MPVKRLKEFLDKNKVRYTVIKHSRAYTAQEIAASAHIPGKDIAKSVVVKIDGKMAMAVLPASCKIDLYLLQQASGANDVTLASEVEFKDAFPECDIGAMPPFGHLYDMDVYSAEKLADDEVIAFNAGTHTELIKLTYEDYEKLAKPKIIKFSCPD
jgi:Ala-tRNA(Pro) deacylase